MHTVSLIIGCLLIGVIVGAVLHATISAKFNTLVAEVKAELAKLRDEVKAKL